MSGTLRFMERHCLGEQRLQNFFGKMLISFPDRNIEAQKSKVVCLKFQSV